MNMSKGSITSMTHLGNTVDPALSSDHGIFITNIIPGGLADANGRLKIGDRLMNVQSTVMLSTDARSRSFSLSMNFCAAN